MFPNPQDALPLPPQPNIERYKKIAKELIKACKSGEPAAIRGWAKEWIESLSELSGLAITPELPVRMQSWIEEVAEFAQRKLLDGDKKCALTDAQFVIARSHGFESWPKFTQHVNALASEARFEAAADAIVSGDIGTLQRLLREEPVLIHARSRRQHGATLLHYVSANGVEGYRQKTPRNIVDIAETLLRAGAEVDAIANVYGGGCTTLELAATSVHPERAGVQEALLQMLLDYGANIDQPSGAGNGQSMVTGCLANGRLKAAEFLTSRGAHVDFVAAAGLGRLDLVEAFYPQVTEEQLRDAFLWACEYGRNTVVEFLLAKGADLAAHSRDGQTALHWAVIGGQLDTVKLLLRHKAPLEVENTYGGTVLGQALWSAAHGGDPELYVAILETLDEAGAKVPQSHASVNGQVDRWLDQHGCHAEPA
ncbi:MAG TPA: ankyrin repeat domain-containing protein [Bryobacteraceae bacterium]|nr:ankyrin repeat domain-containing protein [Bryobacteraceae bacterium]